MASGNFLRRMFYTLLSDQIDDLTEQGYSRGLIKALSENAYSYDFRFWVIDNSGSMQIGDGHRIVPTTKSDGSLKAVASTRWEELRETVQYHAKMSALMDSPTIFKVSLYTLFTSVLLVERKAVLTNLVLVTHNLSS